MMAFAVVALCLVAPAQDDAARPLIERLKSDRIDERDEAARKLKGLGKAAIPALEKAAEDKDREVSARAKAILRLILVTESLSPNLRAILPGIEERLAAGNGHEWTATFLEVGEFDAVFNGKPRRYPKLVKEDLDSLVAPALESALMPGETNQACWTVKAWKLRSAIQPLMKLLDAEAAAVRRMAAWTLADLEAKEAIPKVVGLIADGETWQNVYTSRVIRRLGVQEASPHVLRLLDDKSARVQSHALRVLGDMGATDAVPRILARLEGGPAESRSVAITVMGQLGAADTVAKLTECLQDRLPTLRSHAVLALIDLDARTALPDIEKLLEDKDSGVRRNASLALAHLASPEDLPRMRKLLKNEDAAVRVAAVQALGEMALRQSLPEVEKLLGDPDPDVRCAALQAFPRMDARQSLPSIRKLLRDPTDYVSETAAATLCRMGSPEAPASLLNEPGMKSLNALRQAKVWEGLLKTPLKAPAAGMPKEILTALARQAGLELDLPERLSREEDWWTLDYRRIHGSPDRKSLLAALEEALPLGYVFILEPDRIRLVPRDPALQFWNDWWSAREKK
ncbi:MAG: HEAT repeat domain-containing protein [Planctomycetes bacterium]|nr:HEAT repeat domain-containing protein [Planctomycetota bacterium]